MNSSNFVDKAPPEVVTETRENLLEAENKQNFYAIA
ncbi:hypothetical protein [Synechococcus elongatus]